MMRTIAICLFLGSFLCAADRKYSANALPRHHEMIHHFQKEERGWKYFTGGWGGGRAWLSDHGVTFTSTYAGCPLGNPIGGKNQGFAYTGSYGLDMTLNFGKIAGWQGWYFYTSFVWRVGNNLSRTKIDNQFSVAQIYGGQTYKLNNLYIRKISENKNFMLTFGRLDAGDDFLHSPLYPYYVNNAFEGNPVALFFNTPFTAYPNSTWGAVTEFRPWWKHLNIKLGVYNANSRIAKNKFHGANFTFHSTEGVMWITQWDFSTETTYPGHYSIGGLILTGNKAKFLGGGSKGNYTYYFLLDQMIYQTVEDKGIIPWVALLFSPKDRNLFPFFMTAGIVFEGIVPSRKDDAFVLGIAYGKYSADQRRVEGLNNVKTQSFETILEANYRAQISPFFFFQPDVQYIINPKGLGIQNALVLGAQFGITF